MTDRKDRRAMLETVVEIIQRERGVSWPATTELTSECEDVLERCLFDRDAALAVLRGEHELEDDPWTRCPCCDCDTYFRMRLALERTAAGAQLATPLTVFVCEGCQHVEMRGRSTIDVGEWWTAGTRLRAHAEPAHPYRGDAVDDDESDEDDDDEVESDDDESDDDESEADAAHDEAPGEPVEWNERRVCPDGGCIGIIHANGRCSVCGRTEDASA